MIAQIGAAVESSQHGVWAQEEHDGPQYSGFEVGPIAALLPVSLENVLRSADYGFRGDLLASPTT